MRRWTPGEEKIKREELERLYIKENKTIREIAKILGLAEQTVFQRLGRLAIKSCPEKKENYLKKRKGMRIPNHYSPDLAEFFGIMLGDGHLSHFQIVITLGDKEDSYVCYVANLIRIIFETPAKICTRRSGYKNVYLGCVELTEWLRKEGLVSNKVKSQIDVPHWLFNDAEYLKRFTRGFFDTDGSVYQLRSGTQISFTNKSIPLLRSLRKMLVDLRYKPSEITCNKFYLTRKNEVNRFFEEINPKNRKHLERFKCAGVRAVK